MTIDNFIKGQLAAFAWREAHHHGGLDNMRAVAFVIRNRVQAGWNGGDWMAVLNHHGTIAAHINEAPYPDLRNPYFRLLLQAIDDIYHNNANDELTLGAFFYAELGKIDSQWFIQNIVRDSEHHGRIAVVGPVTFFS